MNSVSLKLKKELRTALTFATADTVKSITTTANGFLRFLIVELPNFTTAATAVLTVVNSDGLTVYTSAALAENTQHNLVINDGYVPMGGSVMFTLTLNDVAGGAHTAYLTAYVR